MAHAHPSTLFLSFTLHIADKHCMGLGNERCDVYNNNEGCAYDLGDCCLQETNCAYSCYGDWCNCHETGEESCIRKYINAALSIEMLYTFVFQTLRHASVEEMVTAILSIITPAATTTMVTAAFLRPIVSTAMQKGASATKQN